MLQVIWSAVKVTVDVAVYAWAVYSLIKYILDTCFEGVEEDCDDN